MAALQGPERAAGGEGGGEETQLPGQSRRPGDRAPPLLPTPDASNLGSPLTPPPEMGTCETLLELSEQMATNLGV